MVAMKYLVMALAMVAMISGCASNGSKSASAGDSGLDLNSAPLASATPSASAAPSASYVPPAPEPVMSDPIAPVAATPISASSSSGPIDGSSYVVKKGDTLYHIAKARYGDGKQWQKIAMANPGLTPQSLRVGQKLALPQ